MWGLCGHSSSLDKAILEGYMVGLVIKNKHLILTCVTMRLDCAIKI